MAVQIQQSDDGRAAAGDYFENIFVSPKGRQRSVPLAEERQWSPEKYALLSGDHDQAQIVLASNILTQHRLVCVSVRDHYSRLYDGVIAAIVATKRSGDRCIKLRYNIHEEEDFESEYAWSLPALIKSIPASARGKIIVVRANYVRHAALIENLMRYRQTSAMEAITSELCERDIDIVITIDKSESQVIVPDVEVKPLYAVKNAVLTAGNKQIDPVQLDRICASRLLGTDEWIIANELHDKIIDGKLAEYLNDLGHKLDNGQPQEVWN